MPVKYYNVIFLLLYYRRCPAGGIALALPCIDSNVDVCARPRMLPSQKQLQHLAIVDDL